jgi:DNA-binding transcriptional ArsR family regulator
MDGYIKLHRKILDSAVFQSPALLKVWTWCLLRANWAPRQLMTGQVLEPGQLILSYNRAADALDMSKSTVFRHIKALEQLGNITLKVERKWTTLTLCQWGTYQDDETKGGTIAERKWNDSRTQMERQPNANGTIGETEEERKKVRRKERKNKGVFLSFDEMKLVFNGRLDTDVARAAMRQWIDYQTARGTPPPTRDGPQLILERYAVSGSNALARDIEHCIAQNWAGLYPRKDTGGDDPAKPLRDDPAEAWQNILFRVHKCAGHDISDGRCQCCKVPADYIERAERELDRNGVL